MEKSEQTETMELALQELLTLNAAELLATWLTAILRGEVPDRLRTGQQPRVDQEPR